MYQTQEERRAQREARREAAQLSHAVNRAVHQATRRTPSAASAVDLGDAPSGDQPRRGPGRPKGARNKPREMRVDPLDPQNLVVRAVDYAAAQERSPLDTMLENMHFFSAAAATLYRDFLEAQERTDHQGRPLPPNPDLFDQIVRLRRMAQVCAGDAAPYLHAKLAQVVIRDETPEGGAPARTVRVIGGLPPRPEDVFVPVKRVDE